MTMPGRSFSSGSKYRYGFNGKELDKDGNFYDYGFRIYNPALGRFLSVDPLTKTYPWYTPYQFAGNKPIIAMDLDGKEEYIIIKWIDNNQLRGALIIHVPKDTYIIAENIEHNKAISEYQNKIALDKSSKYKGYKASIKEAEQHIIDENKTHEIKLKQIEDNYTGKVVYETKVAAKNQGLETVRDESNKLNSNENIVKYVKGKAITQLSENDNQMVNQGIPDYSAYTNGRYGQITLLDIPPSLPVTFNTGSAVLDLNGKEQLTKVVGVLLALPYLKITLTGHTDNVGNAAANFKLSLDRASSSKTFVLSESDKISSDRIKIDGKGQDNPAIPNNKTGGTAENRRIEVTQEK
jgi:RHS repeat-associated protein